MLTDIKYITAIIQRYLSENVWSTTTGRHLTWIDGGSKEAKESRIKYNDLLEIFKAKNINKYYY